jgi:hypothetical protein
MKPLTRILSIILTLGALQVSAQTDKATTQKIVAAQTFVFNATTAIPMADNALNQVLNSYPNSRNNLLNLSGSQYDVQVTKDSVVAYLPYFGRSFNPSINPDDAGTRFKSKDFKYDAVKKKNSWMITIVPNDIKERQKLIFNITEKGYASLSVTNNNRQPISFNGNISEVKKPKKD